MLFLTFQLGFDCYAIHTAQVVEVLPRLVLKAIPGAAKGVAGVFSYHGQTVPVIDLAEMVFGEPARQRLSTRIIIVRYPEGNETHLLGVIAEDATGTLRCSESDFADPGVSAEEAPYLGPVTRMNEKIIQWIKVDRLLSEQVRNQLFRRSDRES